MIVADPDDRRSCISEDVVVTVHPSSRYKSGEPDVASARTTVVLEDGSSLALHREWPVFEDSDGAFRLRLTVPSEFAELVKDAEFSVTVVLPAPALGPRARPRFDLEVVSFTREYVADAGRAGGRTVVTWSGRQDPEVQVVYRYILTG